MQYGCNWGEVRVPMGAYGAASVPAYRLQAYRGAYLSGLQACRAASQRVRKRMGKPIGVHAYRAASLWGCIRIGLHE